MCLVSLCSVTGVRLSIELGLFSERERERCSLCLVSLCSVTGVRLSIELDLLSEREKEMFFVSGKSVLGHWCKAVH